MAPDFVNDLKTLREQKGLELEDVHEKTRIPVDVLKRFESGNLLSDPSYSDVYIRAFLKSYADALGKSTRRILVAYDAHKTGDYIGGLVEESDEKRPSALAPQKPQEESKDQKKTETTGELDVESTEEGEEKKEPSEDASGPVEALSRLEEEPEREDHGAPMVRTTQRFPRRPAQRHVPERSANGTNWLSVFGVLAFLILALGGLLWYLFFYEPLDGQEEAPTAAENRTAPTTENEENNDVAPELVVPIQVTVTAGGDGLQNFRVTETPNERLGHWIEVGESMTFESDSLIILWGEGADGLRGEAMLEFQGFRWAPSDRSILRIDRQYGQQLLDSLHTATSSGS